MKFEYELNYDFVTEELTFKVTKMPESLRGKEDIKKFTVDDEEISVLSMGHPEISDHYIFLRGTTMGMDNEIHESVQTIDNAFRVAKALKEFQSWVEHEYEEPKVEMTVAEIEEKLGIKNLKIVKE